MVALKTKFVDIFNTQFNIIIFILLVYAAFNAFWLSAKGIVSGTLYISILTIGIVLVIFFNFTNQEQKFKFATPFARTNSVAITRIYLGLGLTLILLLSFQGFATFSLLSFQPLNSFKSTQAEATFSALEAQNSPFWTMNTVVVFASVFEELLIGVILVYIFYIIIISVFKDISPDAALWIAIFLDIIAFAVLHSFNATYASLSMYLIAAVFRFVTDVLIYIAGLGVEFTMGIHAANNILYLGADTVLSGLLSLGGIALVLIVFFLFPYMLLSSDESFIDTLKGISYKYPSGS